MARFREKPWRPAPEHAKVMRREGSLCRAPDHTVEGRADRHREPAVASGKPAKSLSAIPAEALAAKG